eukprot:6294859-Amphidinium_carterae.1
MAGLQFELSATFFEEPLAATLCSDVFPLPSIAMALCVWMDWTCSPELLQKSWEKHSIEPRRSMGALLQLDGALVAKVPQQPSTLKSMQYDKWRWRQPNA